MQFSHLASRIAHLASRISHRASRISHHKSLLVLTILFLFLKLPVARTQAITYGWQQELANDPLVFHLLYLRDSITSQIISHGTNLSALNAAIDSGDFTYAQTLAGYTGPQYSSLTANLNTIIDTLYAHYPGLQALNTSMQCNCAACDTASTNHFFKYFYTYANLHADMQISTTLMASLPGGGGPSQPTCHWGPYLAALAACTLSGPLWYWICAYVAMCSFCSGGWIDKACQ